MTENNISSVFSKLKRDGGLPEIFTTKDLRKAYKKVSLKYHPDKGGNAENMKRITSIFSILDKKNIPNTKRLSLTNLWKGLEPINVIQPTWTNNNLNRSTRPPSPVSPTTHSYWNENNIQHHQKMMKKYGVRIGPRAKPHNWPNSPPRKDSPIYHPFDKYTNINRRNVIKMGLYSILVISALVYIGHRWILRKFYKVVRTPKPISPKKKTVRRIVKNKSKSKQT